MDTMELVKPVLSAADRAELNPRQELAILLRLLFAEGFDDHVFGHITVAMGDGTFLSNPRELGWDQVRASDIIVVDDHGRKLEGRGTPHDGLSLHFAVRKYAPAKVVIHNHPHYATLWASAKRIPPVYEQGGALDGREMVLIEDYGANAEIGKKYGKEIAESGWVLMGHHGVAVLGQSFAQAFYRAAVMEIRSKRAWEMQVFKDVKPMDQELVLKVARMTPSDYCDQWWDFGKRRQINVDRSVLN